LIDCLQQNIADRAFTNAKAAGDIEGQTFALIYRALERNTGSVGLASVPCVSVQAVNPEIAALQQHQDPAGEGAQALNKQIAIELARQIASIGGDATLANEASTFAPGQLGDPTARGNTCDDENDDLGCINTQKLRVDDLSAQEIADAIEDVVPGQALDGGNANNNANDNKGAAQACAAVGNNNDNAAADDNKNNNNNAQGNQGGAVSAVSFGSCDVTIVFSANPSDGRQESAFEAKDLTTFPHGSALNIGVISDFVCQQAGNKCGIDAATAAACSAASTAAKALKGQAAADAFNSALGF